MFVIVNFCYQVLCKLKAGDLKSIEKGKDLMDCGKIDACSYVQTATAFFFTGIVSAAMKKSVG